MKSTAKLNAEKLNEYFNEIDRDKINSIAIVTNYSHAFNLVPMSVAENESENNVIATVDLYNGNGTYDILIATTADMLELPDDCRGLFSNMKELTVFDIRNANIDATKVMDISHMFENDKNLQFISLEGCEFTNVKDTSYMFGKCSSLEQVCIGSGFENIDNARSMFEYCSNLGNLDLSPVFEHTEPGRTDYICYKCSSLEEVNMGNISIDTVGNGMFCPFAGANELKQVICEEGAFEPERAGNGEIIGFAPTGNERGDFEI